MVPPPGRGPSQRNPSRTFWTHIFRIRLRSAEVALAPGREQKRFTVGDRKGRLCLIASPDARSGSLRVDQDALIYSSLLEGGQHLVHELLQGRSAWLHVVHGAVSLGDLVLTTGDGAGITAECAVSFTAREDASILLLEVGELQPGVAYLANDPENLSAGKRPVPMQDGDPLSGVAAATLAGSAVFRILWDVLIDILGSAATATILSRAARRAQTRSPELTGLTITREGSEFRFVLPPSFDLGDALPASLQPFLDELRALLLEQTGRVVLRRFDGVSELKKWAA